MDSKEKVIALLNTTHEHLSKIDPMLQLDAVLDIFTTKEKFYFDMHSCLTAGNRIFKGLDRKSKRNIYQEVTVIINHLEKDGHIEKVIDFQDRMGNPYYEITFSGVIFHAKGGYQFTFEKEQNQKRIGILRENLLITGSWIAGIATGCLAVFECLKYFYPNNRPAFSAFSIEFFSLICVAACAGILITILILALRHIREQE